MDDALTATKPGKNKQIPTSRNVHDVSLSDDSLAGVFGLAASYPLLFEDLMSKLMGFLLGRPLPTPLKTMGGVLAVCDGRR